MEEVKGIQEAISDMDVVSKVLHIKKYFEDTPIEDWQMDRITDYMLVLCTLLYNVGDLKDEAYIRAEALSEEYKAGVRDEYLKIKNGGEKITDAMAKAMAEERCDGIKQNELKASLQARKLRGLYEDSNRLIGYTQTKVKTLADNEIRSKIERK